jgi:putative phosphoesterase
MKILVISDSHGHVANLKHVMGFAKKIKVDAIIHCGDWNTIDAVEEVLSSGIPLYTVAGNADIRPEVIKMLKMKSKMFSEEFLEFELGGKKIGVTHKPSDLKRYFESKKIDIIFCGHIHSKDESIVEGVKIVRPGAIINGNNFAVYNTETNKIEFVKDDQV